MAGGGSRREESLVINSTNVFAALGSFKKKKKPSEKGSSKGKSSSARKPEKEPEKEVFWAPTPLTKKSWADVDDEDDDDYYAVTAPPQSVWGATADSATAKDAQLDPESEPALEVRSLFFCFNWFIS